MVVPSLGAAGALVDAASVVDGVGSTTVVVVLSREVTEVSVTTTVVDGSPV